MSRRRQFKLLSLLLLVIVGLVAMNATAAQAKWLLRRNGQSVLDLTLIGELGLSELVIIPFFIEIHCEEAIFEKLLRLNPTHTVLTLEKWEIFFGCELLELDSVCTVSSAGAKPGEIVVSAEGEVKMKGKETYAELSSEKFSQITFAGEECPLAEISSTLSGTLKSTLLNAEEETKTHSVTLDDQELFFGEEEARLDGHLEGEEHADAVEGSTEEEHGDTWSVQLVGL